MVIYLVDINIATTGTREDLVVSHGGGGNQPMSDRTRAVFSGKLQDLTEFVTISSTGNATDWGANLNRNAYYDLEFPILLEAFRQDHSRVQTTQEWIMLQYNQQEM